MSNNKEKINIAIKEIEAILDKHDIAGAAIVHAPERTISVIKVDPSFSCITMQKLNEEAALIGVSLSTKVGKEAFIKFISDTHNMLITIENFSREIVKSMAGIDQTFLDKIEEHTKEMMSDSDSKKGDN